MEPDKEQEKIIKSGLYSSKQLFIATIIGGPAIAGSIIACNLWATDKKSLAIIPVLPGIILGLAILLPIDYCAQFLKSFALSHKLATHILAFGLYFLLQTLFALLIRFSLTKNKLGPFLFPEINENIYHRRKIFPVIIISIVYFLINVTLNFYLWIVLGFYLFTHFYVYICINKAFGNYKIVKPFLVSIVFLACLLPVVDTTCQILSVYTRKEFLSYTYLNLVVGYYVIFVFYIFLFIIGLNILLLLNRLIGFVSLKILKNKTLIFVTIFIAIAFGTIILVIGSYINDKPVISKYSITIPKKSSTLNSLKVICVSDLHLKTITSTTFLKRLVKKISMENPDIIVLPGDIVETYGNIHKEKLNEFLEILKGIKSKFGIYAVKGNHDFPGDMADKIDFYKRLGMTMLTDSLIETDNKFCVIGLKYRGNNEKRPIDSLLKFKTKDLPILLLDHAPYCLEEACKNKIDVQFSGHTHYGQIWPLNYVTKALYEIAWGYKKIDSTHFFVSCGVQDASMPSRQDFSVPVRIGSLSEIMEINIKFRVD